MLTKNEEGSQVEHTNLHPLLALIKRLNMYRSLAQ